MKLGKAPASMGSSYAGLRKRGRPGIFKCGDHGVQSISFKASGTHRAGSWRPFMTPAGEPTRCSSVSVSRPNQRPATHAWPKKLV